jgi:hypothetical protein
MKPEWFTEDGTFIGPWWLRWAWFATTVSAPIAWLFITGSISMDYLMAWVIFMALMNLLRAKQNYEPIVRLAEHHAKVVKGWLK